MIQRAHEQHARGHRGDERTTPAPEMIDTTAGPGQ
jgi:hypothetical protein